MLYARRAPTKDDLEKHQDDLLRTANAIRAMSVLAPYRIEKMPARNENDRKERQRIVLEFKTAADEFRSAVAEKDPMRVKSAADRLNHTCCDCHSVVDR